MYKKTTLRNGLRIITAPMKGAENRAATILLLVAAGSKYENKKNNGISHFLEHLFFKGTEKRPNTLAISSALDKVGGVYNAFTSQEYTGYWAKVDAKHFDLALDWLADIYLNSKFEEKEIKKEKGVIIEEINMYLDDPLRYVFDLWYELLYSDQPAGWPVIGKKQIISKFKRNDFLNYLEDNYSAANTVIAIAGKIKEKEALQKVKKCFQKIRVKKAKLKLKVKEKQKEPRILNYFKETDQTHFCFGTRGYNLFDKRRYSQQIIATILGGSMSSRLFISLRDKHGLAYYVHSFSENFTDSGCLLTHAGVDNKRVEEALKLILEEYRSLKEKLVDEEELQKAKDYLKGRLILSLESSDAQASFYGLDEVLTGKILTPEEEIKQIEAVKKEEILKTSRSLFQPEKLNLALIGPFKSKEPYLKILKGGI